jgi:hypothetical protein
LLCDTIDRMTVDPFADSPDFARLYGDPDSTLSPRMASQLWTTAIYLADTYADPDVTDLLKRELPPIARRMADDVWMERFVVCFEAIATRLARGRFASSQLASCTGEEMALHLVIDSAEAGVSDDAIPLDDSLPADPERDRDFEWAREVLFRDHDFLLLFNPSLDGIEDNDSDLSQRHMFANLHPQRWFLPFPDQLDDEPEG